MRAQKLQIPRRQLVQHKENLLEERRDAAFQRLRVSEEDLVFALQ